MSRSRPLFVLLPTLLFSLACAGQRKDDSNVTGIYVNQNNVDKWIVISGDRTLQLYDGKVRMVRKYELDGSRITVNSLGWSAELRDDVLYDDKGDSWTRQTAKHAPNWTLRIKFVKPKTGPKLPILPQDTPLRLAPRHCEGLSLASPCIPT
jgi:hypothetical protein